MQKGIIAITLITALGLAIAPSALANVHAQAEATKCQTGALIGYGGTVFGVANLCTNGYTINVDLATNYQPKEGWVFNAWLVDDSYEGSGYPLVMGKVLTARNFIF